MTEDLEHKKKTPVRWQNDLGGLGAWRTVSDQEDLWNLGHWARLQQKELDTDKCNVVPVVLPI